MPETAEIEFASWDEVIKLWPSDAEFARGAGLKPSHLGVLKVRGRIPSDYWPAIIADAETRGVDGVTADSLLKLQQRLREASGQ